MPTQIKYKKLVGADGKPYVSAIISVISDDCFQSENIALHTYDGCQFNEMIRTLDGKFEKFYHNEKTRIVRIG